MFKARLSTMVTKSLVTVLSGLGCKTTESSPAELAPPSLVTATTASARATDNTLSAIDSAACFKCGREKKTQNVLFNLEL